MKNIFFVQIFCALIVNSLTIFSQPLTQTVKGKIIDVETQVPLIGANVIIQGINPPLGSITDVDGNFTIKNVPLGRYNIQITYLGYDPFTVPEVIVTSGKEVVLNTGLKQSITQMGDVTVKAYSRKDQPLNRMATVSARSFTVEEGRRYAGGLDDPARLVSSFAGVSVGNLQDNAIIIRGNSPKGVLWKLEGVEIPNPNHFPGGNVAGGGFVTVFSSQLLANSDFYTAAFPSEYNNALAGVFDMKLRNGNSGKRESTFQIGMLGIDFASEGPFKQRKEATYLFNYRYSTLGLISKMGIIGSEQIPKYQDLSFKMNFPSKKAGTFSVWAVGAIDENSEPEDRDSTVWESDWDKVHYDWTVNMGAGGISHKYIISNKTFINNTIAVTGTYNRLDQKTLNNELMLVPDANLKDLSGKIVYSLYVNYKFNPKISLKSGITYNNIFYNLDFSSAIGNNPSSYQQFINEGGNSHYIEVFSQSKFDLSDNLVLNAGINACHFVLNNDYSVDPRIGLRWEFIPNHSLSFGYGKHTQLEELKIYLMSKQVNGKTIYPNKNLEFSHAQHFVLGYDWLISSNLRLKIEPYYQYIYNAPGIPDSSYSMINFKQDWTFRDSLANNSTGKNYGVDLTFERFLNNNFYYLFTVSVFDSKYKADDNIWRNTRFNKNFVFNILFGKEFYTKNNRIFGVNARLNFNGGERYSPALVEKSVKEKYLYTDENKSFSVQNPPSLYLDVAFSLRTNRNKHSGLWSLQVKNALGSPLYEGDYYNYKTKRIERSSTVVIVPFLSYKIDF